MPLRIIGAVILFAIVLPAQTGKPPDSPDMLARVGQATAIVLSGEGAGRLSAIVTAVVVRPDGMLLTAYHALKNAAEVQVRLKSGETFDRATLVGVDERRDVAALRISAVNLPSLIAGSAQNTRPGDVVYAVTNANGQAWSATQGISNPIRMAEEIPGAGQGYRVLSFTAAVPPGSSGGLLVDAKGNLAGIITRANAQGAAFAVPIESVIGLIDAGGNTPLGDGAALQLPNNRRSPSSRAVANADPKQLLRNAKTAVIHSKTSFFTVETLEHEFVRVPGYAALGLLLVKDARVADLAIAIDRPLFTYTFTYAITDSKTSVVLDSGKVTAIDGNTAAGKIAKEIVKRLSELRSAENSPKAN